MARDTRWGAPDDADEPKATSAPAGTSRPAVAQTVPDLLVPVSTYLLVFGLYGLYAMGPRSLLNWLAGEDRAVEWAGTVALLAGGLLFTLAFARSKGAGQRIGRLRTSRNILLLVFAFVTIFAAGEEISWGQRILGFETPDALASVNEQDEFNLHNLRALNPLVDGQGRSELRLFLTANRAFALFVVALVAGWPLLHAASRTVRRLNERLRIPVVPLWLAPLVILIPVLVRVVDPFIPLGFNQGHVHEVKESLNSVMLGLAAWYTYRGTAGAEVARRDRMQDS